MKSLPLLLTISALLVSCSTVAPKDDGRFGLFDIESRPGPRPSIIARDGSDDVSASDIGGTWQWPLKKVDISSRYGLRGRKFHGGTDLRANTGTEVFAASDGKVVYSASRIRGYGRMVVLQHVGGVYSVYAHNSKNLVKVGEDVDRGELIALSGRSGRVTGAHVHFEIRKGVHPIDPEQVSKVAGIFNRNQARMMADRRNPKNKRSSKTRGVASSGARKRSRS